MITIEDIERSVVEMTEKIASVDKGELEAMETKLKAFNAWFLLQDRDRCRVMNKIVKANDEIFKRKRSAK